MSDKDDIPIDVLKAHAIYKYEWHLLASGVIEVVNRMYVMLLDITATRY